MPPRQKFVALLTVALGLVVLVAAAIALKDPLLEKWYLHRLESGDEIERRAASEALAHMGSRVVPGILEAMRRVDHSSEFAISTLTHHIQFSRYLIFQDTLNKIGKPAVPCLVRALDDKNSIFAYIVLHILRGMYADAWQRAWAEAVGAGLANPSPVGLKTGGEVLRIGGVVLRTAGGSAPELPTATRWGPLPLDNPTTLLEILEKDPSEPTGVREAAAEMLRKIKGP